MCRGSSRKDGVYGHCLVSLFLTTVETVTSVRLTILIMIIIIILLVSVHRAVLGHSSPLPTSVHLRPTVRGCSGRNAMWVVVRPFPSFRSKKKWLKRLSPETLPQRLPRSICFQLNLSAKSSNFFSRRSLTFSINQRFQVSKLQSWNAC